MRWVRQARVIEHVRNILVAGAVLVGIIPGQTGLFYAALVLVLVLLWLVPTALVVVRLKKRGIAVVGPAWSYWLVWLLLILSVVTSLQYWPWVAVFSVFWIYELVSLRGFRAFRAGQGLAGHQLWVKMLFRIWSPTWGLTGRGWK